MGDPISIKDSDSRRKSLFFLSVFNMGKHFVDINQFNWFQLSKVPSMPGGGTHIEKGYGDVSRSRTLFSGQSPLPSLPIYRQCAALMPPVFTF